MDSILKVTGKRQAKLPPAFCNEFGIKPGDELILNRRNLNGKIFWVINVPNKIKPEWYASLRGYAKGKCHAMASVRKTIAKHSHLAGK